MSSDTFIVLVLMTMFLPFALSSVMKWRGPSTAHDAGTVWGGLIGVAYFLVYVVAWVLALWG